MFHGPSRPIPPLLPNGPGHAAWGCHRRGARGNVSGASTSSRGQITRVTARRRVTLATFLLLAATASSARGQEASRAISDGAHGEANAAVHKAAGQGAPVTQEIAVSVKGDQMSCAINGTVVATYRKSELVGDGKLASTDGVYGIRFAHNTEAAVTGLTMVPEDGAKK